MTHPSYETLVKYIERQLNDQDREVVEKHLAASCPSCAKQLAQLRKLLDAAGSDRTSAPPASVLKQAIGLYQKRPREKGNPILRALATLTFDSRLQLSAIASRGAAHARQMLFSTQQVDIDLKITPEQDNHSLVGQVLAAEQNETAFVSLCRTSGETLMGTETDTLGQFALKKIPSGVYDLVFDLGNQEVAIAGLEIAHEQG